MKMLGILVYSILVSIFGAFGFKQLWFWFLVPFGLPTITIAWAFGISCVKSAMFNISRSKGMFYIDSKASKEDEISTYVYPLLSYVYLLLVGYIVYLFM